MFTEILLMPGGGTRCPITPENVDQRLNTIKMSGKEVYKQAVTSMFNAATRVLDEAGLRYEDIDCVIPHQANLRIIEAIAERMGLPMERGCVEVRYAVKVARGAYIGVQYLPVGVRPSARRLRRYSGERR